MLIPYIVSYFSVKLSEEVLPSELTSSVEVGEVPPPMSSVSSPSPPTFQHRWWLLSCIRLTEVLENCPVRGSSRRHELFVFPPPPHIRRPHKVWKNLAAPGMSGSLQWLPV